LKYSIDTSAILDCWIRYYPPDVFPQVWEKLDDLINAGILIATEQVLIELGKKDDEVYQWAQKREHMFIPINEDIQPIVSFILQNHPKLIDERKDRTGADPFVIALAQLEKCTVLTCEKPTNKLNRPKIPDVCNALKIPWVNMLQLFREQGWKFS